MNVDSRLPERVRRQWEEERGRTWSEIWFLWKGLMASRHPTLFTLRILSRPLGLLLDISGLEFLFDSSLDSCWLGLDGNPLVLVLRLPPTNMNYGDSWRKSWSSSAGREASPPLSPLHRLLFRTWDVGTPSLLLVPINYSWTSSPVLSRLVGMVWAHYHCFLIQAIPQWASSQPRGSFPAPFTL